MVWSSGFGVRGSGLVFFIYEKNIDCYCEFKIYLNTNSTITLDEMYSLQRKNHI